MMIVTSVHYLLLLPSFTDFDLGLICCSTYSLGDNNIRTDGAKALVQALQTISTMTELK